MLPTTSNRIASAILHPPTLSLHAKSHLRTAFLVGTDHSGQNALANMAVIDDRQHSCRKAPVASQVAPCGHCSWQRVLAELQIPARIIPIARDARDQIIAVDLQNERMW
jgi:hypothetical protein